VLVEELPVTGDRAIYPVRGSRDHRRKAVLLAGWCGNPAWYLNAFLYPAARYGDFVGLQGDIDCGGAATRWSGNLASLVRRAETAFAHAGVGELEDVTVVGYSQGAERAEWLAAYDPVRFTRFVLVAGPIPPSATHFARAHAVVLMAGSRESQTHMREGAARLREAGILATFMLLPGAHHGEMGPEAQDVMAKALDWLEENDRVTKSAQATVTRRFSGAIGE